MHATRNICLTIQYDGTPWHGWQRQKGLPTVQEALERGISKLTKEPCSLHGAGRTDTGVHALGQTANFHTSSPIPLDRWCLALNSVLPASIRVTEARHAPLDWHARFSPNWKHYRYTIEQASIGNPLLRHSTWQRHGDLDFCLLQAAAQLVIGEHNFKAFCASGSIVKSHTRSVRRSFWEQQGDLLHYHIEGNGFLYNMVRLLVGGMTHIACGKWSLADMQQALSSGYREGTLFCAPPQGLCLMAVIYEDEPCSSC